MTTFVGRRAKSPYARGVCVRLPSLLLDAIDAYADAEICLRTTAIRILLERGLAESKPRAVQGGYSAPRGGSKPPLPKTGSGVTRAQ
jgi:hypothetical protein